METENQKAQDSEIKLDRKSKILFLILGILIVGSVAATYWRYMVQRDYIIQAQIDCDPETENCFIWKCDPMSLEEGEQCTGVPDNDIWFYKILNRNAKNIPDCDPKDENCAAYVCGEGEKDCSYELCDSGNVPKGKECNDPQKYLEENPPADDSKCDPDDEECIDESAEEQCAPDDQECASQSDSETGEISPASQNAPSVKAEPIQ